MKQKPTKQRSRRSCAEDRVKAESGLKPAPCLRRDSHSARRYRIDRIEHGRFAAARPGHYTVEAVTAHRDAVALARLARELGARFAAIADARALSRSLKSELAGTGIEAAAGETAIVEAAQRPADWVMAAITGAASLAPTLAAAERGATVALANKECLVCAGALFMRRAAAKRRDGPAGRFRAQRDLPGAERRSAGGHPTHRAYGIRRSVPDLGRWTRSAKSRWSRP